jgi:hypothetical protein
MPRDHFSKMMKSPYFQTDHYQNESEASKIEAKIENKIYLFIELFKFKKRESK